MLIRPYLAAWPPVERGQEERSWSDVPDARRDRCPRSKADPLTLERHLASKSWRRPARRNSA